MHTTEKLEWFYREISWGAMWHTTREIDEIRDIMFDIACASSIELGMRWIHDREFYYNYDDNSHINSLELGLRWLNDRIEEDNQQDFVNAIKGAFPSIMTGIAHGLVLDAQQKLTDELKGDCTTMRKLHKRARELTKQRKKNIP